MRTIKFRGMTRRKGEKVRLDGTPIDGNWVYGGVFFNNDGGDFSIIYQQEPKIEKFPVYSDTVGQFTELHDKNGKEIYEGDVVFVTDDDGCSGQVDTGIGEVVFLEGLWYIDGRVSNGLYDINRCYCIEVIGNIYENPELLQKEGVE